MRVKRLYTFILQTFLPLFAMTFFIVLFIVLMQFLWRYIDDLVGKGFSIGVLAELFFYAAVSMVPMALPLAILLASLMTFGNLGEKFELTAMKASGISLIRVMSPLTVLISLVAVGAFFFQNNVLPHAQVKMWTLLFSMRQTSPELEIPEGVFYDQITGYNLYVEKKNRDTGMLYNVMIYDASNGGDNATILLADSARLAMAPDLKHLFLHLYTGEQFENLRDQSSGTAGFVPFRRESFQDKQILIPFDAGFSRMDEEGMRNQYVGKNMTQLLATIDSLTYRVDSIGKENTEYIENYVLPTYAVVKRKDKSETKVAEVSEITEENTGRNPEHTSEDRTPGGPQGPVSEENSRDVRNSEVAHMENRVEKPTGKKEKTYNPVRTFSVDSLLQKIGTDRARDLISGAQGISRNHQSELEFKALYMYEEKKSIRRHGIELYRKFTLSVACLIFFFIGAPLGAIIRKGGLGTPLVISIILFLVYYIIDNAGYKMARDGRWPVWAGMWLSSVILAPLGVYVTWKAMNDSVIFNKDLYVNLIRKILGIRGERHVDYKEVVMNEFNASVTHDKAVETTDICRALLKRIPALLPSLNPMKCIRAYVRYCISGLPSSMTRRLPALIDETVEELTDSRNTKLLGLLPKYPVVRNLWVYRPVHIKWGGIVLAVVFPIGIPVWCAGIFQLRILRKDLQAVKEISETVAATLYPSFSEEGLQSAEPERTEPEGPEPQRNI